MIFANTIIIQLSIFNYDYYFLFLMNNSRVLFLFKTFQIFIIIMRFTDSKHYNNMLFSWYFFNLFPMQRLKK